MTLPINPRSLRTKLADWQDYDIAACYLAVALGIAPSDHDFCGKKWVFWSANPIGDRLHQMLLDLVELGVLENDDEECKFRWNPDFDWEGYGSDAPTPDP